ncbi:hypothetical protein C0992_004479 [Termitomyces sp. T32_za158]|nr:hypothetical protein C0992_004479 [Termitomyces sp. T32_za158]
MSSQVSYFDQATEISRLLNIKLASRKWGNGRVPMCGFPLPHLDKYLKVLVQQHKRFVAMCEEFPRHSEEGTRTFDRRVTRVVTPGTLIDEPFLNPFENNYLLAIGIPDIGEALRTDYQVGLAWIDVSTGEFFSRSTSIDALRDELAQISPREVVLDVLLQQEKDHLIYEALAEDDNFVSYIGPTRMSPEEINLPSDLVAIERSNQGNFPGEPDIKGRDASLEEASAIRLLTAYLHANLLEHMPILSSPNREASEERMQIDSHTIKALEIREGFREGGTKGSLLSVIKRTVTNGGSRLLSRWLCSPSTSISEINARQSLVAFFLSRPHFHADLAEALATVEDTSRIAQKFMLGRGETADLLGVKRTIRVWTDIIKRVQHEKEMELSECSKFEVDDWKSLDALISRMESLDSLSKRIGTALDDKPSNDFFESTSTDTGTVEENEEACGNEDEAILRNGTETLWRYGTSKWAIKPRPQMTEDPIYKVINGRHPTVELGLLAAGRVFTPNSVALTPTSRLHVITGPNMAGKSTFLRQTALIAILAQTGSFVPADFAVLGIVDRLFSRIGAKDDLFHDRSTFMVEMLETSEILRRATPKSLVIMDEVGRGTTVKDGLAIAYATLHHLVHNNQCRALFATHFHELSDMLGYPDQTRRNFGSVEFFCTDVDEIDDDRFAYQYRIRPGVNRDSHGLKVAQLAGMPTVAVNIARDTLALLKKETKTVETTLVDSFK